MPSTMTKRKPCLSGAAQEPSHATMPCTWTGYGEPLPRLPINTGEMKKKRGGEVLKKEKRGTFKTEKRKPNRKRERERERERR